jgi:pyruvate formate lyase activating enzyme
MKIAGFVKTTLLDWEGKVACTVYLAGCDFRCPFCHNRDIVLSPDASAGTDENVIMEYVTEHSDFLDGVVISGGEPLINRDLADLIKKLKRLGMRIKLDTNGNNPDELDDLVGAGLVDFVAMDVKCSLNSRYAAAAGSDVDLEKIRRSIRVIIGSGVDHEFRTTVAPIYVKEDDIENICREIRGAKRYRLHQFRPKNTIDPSLSVLDPYPEERLHGMAVIAKKYVSDVRIRGI